jgi:hypothetical protein
MVPAIEDRISGVNVPQWYPAGSRPRIVINWDSFVAQGINPAWQGPFTDCVINAYTRWMNLAGVDIRPQFFGYTTQTPPVTPGDLLILMTPWHGGGAARIASTLGAPNAIYIEFHRRVGVNGTPWNFVPWNAMPGEIDMQAIAIHELGHALGLDHSASSNDAMFGSYIYHSARYGPWEGDVASLKALYPDFQQNRLRELRSSDGAVTWAEVPNELTSHSHWHTRTNQSAGAAAIRASGLYNVGWTHSNRIPTWLRNDGDKFLTRLWYYFGGERTVHGPAYASDNRGTVLWARVQNDDNATIRVSRSTNRALTWAAAGVPPGSARSGGLPGLAWTRVGGQSCWILVWSHLDRADQTNTGFLRASISLNDGATWSAPVFLNQTTKALSGVSIAATDANAVMVAFAFANHVGVAGLNQVVTVPCTVAGSQLQAAAPIFTPERTRIQPALAYDHGHGRFVLAWREQNFATTLATMVLAPGAQVWSGKAWLLNRPSHVAPALTSSPEYSEAVIWYAHE